MQEKGDDGDLANPRRQTDVPGVTIDSRDLAVRNALVIQALWGTVSAIEYLIQRGVPSDVVRRILDAEGLRRGTDPNSARAKVFADS